MGISGFNENNISEQNKKTLQSEIWKEMRKVMKTEVVHFTETPEIQHFAVEKVSRNDNVYGVVWGNVVREYLKTAYSEGSTQADVISDGVKYKVLKRAEITAFYDTDGNTLFDVENTRLEKEYGYVMQEEKMAVASEEKNSNADEAEEKSSDIEKAELGKETGEAQEEKAEDTSRDDMPDSNNVPSDPVAIKQMAKEKLEKEMKAAKDKGFAEPIISYLLGRCADDVGLAQDVMQEHKAWQKCLDYIYEKARQQAVGNRAAVRDEVVFEWAEDYYHKDDKAEEEKRVKKEAARKQREAENKKNANKNIGKRKNTDKHKTGKGNSAAKPQSEQAVEKETARVKKNSKNIEGQMDLFSMLGL